MNAITFLHDSRTQTIQNHIFRNKAQPPAHLSEQSLEDVSREGVPRHRVRDRREDPVLRIIIIIIINNNNNNKNNSNNNNNNNNDLFMPGASVLI